MAAGLQLRIRLSRIRGVTKKGVLHDPLRFPVVLGDSFDVTEEGAWEDFLTVGAGELSAPLTGRGARMLKDFSTETMAMSWDPSWMTYPGQDPQRIRRDLYQILRSQTPIHLLAIVGPRGDQPEFKGAATLRSITRRLPHGEPDTRYYQLDFRQYREPQIRRRRHGRVELPTKHRLRKKDTLRALAKRYYGNGQGWKAIGRKNGVRNWGSEDRLTEAPGLRVGDRITIPKWSKKKKKKGGDGYQSE